MENLDEVDGQVTMLGTNQFTLMNARSGQSFTISVDQNTTFQDFDRAACTANPEDFTCVKTGQILDVDLREDGTGTMLAKRVEFEENASEQAIKGTITSVESNTQFHMVVFREEPDVNGISEGSQVVVTIAPNATFQVGREEMGEFGGFDIFGFSFASGMDLLVGQDVQIRPVTVVSAAGVNTVTTDLVRLWPSQITGQVATINSSNGTFTLTSLSPLFTGATAPITMITVQTLAEMDFMDFSNESSLAVGDTVSVKGLLFKTTGAPTLVTRTIRHDGE
jgi:ribosomal protein L35AE/L33A